MKPVTISSIKKKKNQDKIVMITAYDALMAHIFDEEVDMILVGDSLAMSFGGHKDTLSLTLDEMIYHVKAVKRATSHALIIADMPFGSYMTPKQTLKNAIRIYRETGADAIKLEGGIEKLEHIKTLTENGIAVMGHIGLQPQSVRGEGGYKIKGKNDKEIEKLMKDVQLLNQAGVFSIVLEGVISHVATTITKASEVPIVGIGCGSQVDGQVLVWSDAFGFFQDFQPKFVRRYLNGAELLKQGVRQYAQDVKNGSFPNESESYQ